MFHDPRHLSANESKRSKKGKVDELGKNRFPDDLVEVQDGTISIVGILKNDRLSSNAVTSVISVGR